MTSDTELRFPDQSLPLGRASDPTEMNGELLTIESEGGAISATQGIATYTAIGFCHVRQPLESCFNQCAATSCTSTMEEQPAVTLPANRAFSNSWVKVSLSPLGGYGVFAAVDIPRDTHILVEQPIIWMKNPCRFGFTACSMGKKEVDQLRIVYSFIAGGGNACFAIASNFNHACESMRNTGYRWDPTRKVMTYTVLEAVSTGEELLISYGLCRELLRQRFGFLCQCGGCDGHSGWTIPSDVFDNVHTESLLRPATPTISQRGS
ncbi:hypothetical protein BD289DRAFT_451288 [Coniella lustricola]|uniref:SET domain-containing protein n=1 Tax=Coniella lustricola TaxID=2025994 RepID=A0A2T3AFG1_9PEZI|nr:hypothetical protein BD289DRAFT_451288 [Coniella lustricola]